MKNVLYILNDGVRRFTYARIAGLARAVRNADEAVNLYIMRSEGHASFTPEHNCGEYNIFRLPDYSAYDGIFLDVNSNFTADANAFAASGTLYAIRAAVASGRPVVSMANAIEGCYYVGIDNYDAMASVIRHLHTELGLTDFWFAMGPTDNYESGERTRALRDYCLEHGLPCGEERFYAESFLMDCGLHAFEKLRTEHGGALPQAVICGNDLIAAGVCRAAEAAGVSVPRDTMVTGFDNQDLSAYFSPSLTTLDQLCWTMGQACMDTMTRIWRGEDVPRVINTPTSLVLRESTGNAGSMGTDMKDRVVELLRTNADTTEFGYRLNVLQYQLPGCETLEEICMALVSCVSALGCTGVRLVLDRALSEYENSTDSEQHMSRALDISDKLCTEGYSERMDLVFSWEAGKPPRMPRHGVGRTPSVGSMGGQGENCLFIPLHFMEHSIGYLALRNCTELVRLKCISPIANSLTMTLRSYFARNKLSCYNQLLSGLSMKDDLTGLHNRLGYHRLAYPLFRKTCEEGGRLAVVFLDLDRLKFINDSYGHTIGDGAIAGVSRAIVHCMPETAVAVRYGGDEFLLLFPVSGEEAVQALIADVRERLPEEAERAELPCTPGVSAGYVLTDPQSARSLDDYVEEADGLMYREKSLRRK
ncbi:MAG: GGDEF domain-containing protein [Oscillospiraceae bacterium]|nr:GGDEF domain-containing protein [Oscillospiraceae bacterium]